METYKIKCSSCQHINEVQHPSLRSLADLLHISIDCRGCGTEIKAPENELTFIPMVDFLNRRLAAAGVEVDPDKIAWLSMDLDTGGFEPVYPPESDDDPVGEVPPVIILDKARQAGKSQAATETPTPLAMPAHAPAWARPPQMLQKKSREPRPLTQRASKGVTEYRENHRDR